MTEGQKLALTAMSKNVLTTLSEYKALFKSKQDYMSTANINDLATIFSKQITADQKELFDKLMSDEKMKNTLTWLQGLISNKKSGRVEDEEFDGMSYLSSPVQSLIATLGQRVDNVVATYDTSDPETLRAYLVSALGTTESEITNSSTLTQDEKNVLYIVINQHYDLLPTMIENALSLESDPYPARVMKKNFWKVLGSIVVHAVIIGAVGGIIAMSLGAGAFTIGLWAFEFEVWNVGAVIGVGVGTIVGGALAINNICADFGRLNNGLSLYTTCD